jgi:diguanylate cyclase (GGDEF)-like protein/putative nucleotidyltransferase with HDIG domain
MRAIAFLRSAATTRQMPGTDRAGIILSALLVAGSSLGLVALATPDPAYLDEWAVQALVAGGYVLAGTVLLATRWAGIGALQLAVAIGTILITLGIHVGSAAASPYVLLYVWMTLYAFYFFTPLRALVQVAVVGVGYGVVSLGDHLLWWLIMMGTLAGGGMVIVFVRARISDLLTRLEHLVKTDPLTDLMNRRGFRESLDRELERAERFDEPLAVVLGDLDHFKQVNDVHGHDAGDAALRRAARVLAAGIRRIDAAARMGGEEFALLLVRSDAAGALEVTDRLRLSMREEFWRGPQLSISFGIASYPAHGHTAEALLGAADRSLYTAKQLGRDRAVVEPVDGEMPGIDRTDGQGRIPGQLVRMLALAQAGEVRDSGGVTHSEIVARYAEMIARQLDLPEPRIERIRLAALLHDVGKIYIPEQILRKPGKLTAEEWAEIKKHVELSARLVEHEDLADIQGWIRAHHERPDGTGYPLGLSGDEIPLESRILAVADAYEAMTSGRPYSSPKGGLVARRELRALAGRQFDRRVVDAFLTALGAPSRDGTPASGALPRPRSRSVGIHKA